MNVPVSATGRALCPACRLPERSCICRWAVPMLHRAEVLVLQHPLEAGNAKNSVRLLRACLAGPGCHVEIGESFAPQALEALLHGPLPGIESMTRRQPVLLYPELPGQPAAAERPMLPAHADMLRLVVLDGTWRKSRRMFDANRALAILPRLALADPPPSRYRIRRARRPDQLSTLEAVCHALARLENREGAYQPLLEAFDGFIGQRLAFMPKEGDDRSSG
jgi:DTW domain-containing protein YfiP